MPLPPSILRHLYNCLPAYWGTGGRIEYIAADFMTVRVRIPLSWRTRNIVGTIFGGSMFAATDPPLMVMLRKHLADCVVWDKSGSIRCLKPARTTLYATFRITDSDLDSIRAAVRETGTSQPEFQVDLVDSAGVPHASITRLLHVRSRDRARSSSARPQPD